MEADEVVVVVSQRQGLETVLVSQRQGLETVLVSQRQGLEAVLVARHGLAVVVRPIAPASGPRSARIAWY